MALPDGRAEHKTGAIYDIVPPATLVSKHVGEWNTFEIHAMGQNYTIILNEITVIPKFSGNRLRRGYIGIQNHDTESHDNTFPLSHSKISMHAPCRCSELNLN